MNENNYNFDNYQPAPQVNSSRNPFPPFSNITLVDSLEHALRMPARMHSEMVYWNRHKDEIYRIYTDYSNNKQYMVLDVKIHQIPKEVKNEDSKKSLDLSVILEKLEKLEAKVEELDGKHNVKPDDGVSEQSAK